MFLTFVLKVMLLSWVMIFVVSLNSYYRYYACHVIGIVNKEIIIMSLLFKLVSMCILKRQPVDTEPRFIVISLVK